MNRINSIQVIRALASITILIYHSGIFGAHGYTGADLLFIVSGFIMMKSTEKTTNKFLLKRIIRIVPLYWAATLFMYFLLLIAPGLSIMSQPKIEYLVKSMFFIPFRSESGYITPMLAIGWTLNYEMYFYLIFSISLMISHKYRMIISSLLITVLCIIGEIFRGHSFVLLYLGDKVLIECIWGMIVYYIYQNRNNMKWKMNILYPIAMILLFAYVWWDLFPDRLIRYRCFTVGIAAAIFVLLFLLYFEDKRIPTFMIKIGNMSYSIYIVEFFTTALYKQLLVRYSSVSVQIVLLIFTIIVTIGVSVVSYYVFENKITKYLLKKFKVS